MRTGTTVGNQKKIVPPVNNEAAGTMNLFTKADPLMEEGPHVKLGALDGLKGGKLGTVVQMDK